MIHVNHSIGQFLCAFASCAVLSFSTPALPQTDNSSVLSPEQKAAIERLIRDYIVKNPDVLLEAQAALEARAETQRVDTIR